jgi:hypothetical protein
MVQAESPEGKERYGGMSSIFSAKGQKKLRNLSKRYRKSNAKREGRSSENPKN